MKQKILSVLLAGAAAIGAVAATSAVQDTPEKKVGTVDMWGNEWSPFLSCKIFSSAPGCVGLRDQFDAVAETEKTPDENPLALTRDNKIHNMTQAYTDAQNTALEKDQRLAYLVQAYAQAKELWDKNDTVGLPAPFNDPKTFASEVQKMGNDVITEISERLAYNIANTADIYGQYELSFVMRDTIERLDSVGLQRSNDSYAKLGTYKDKFEAELYAVSSKLSAELLAKMDGNFKSKDPMTAIEQTWSLQYLNEAFGVMSEIKPDQKADLANTYCKYRALIAPDQKSNICTPTMG